MISRRDMLHQSALGFGSLALTSLLQAENPLAAKRPHFRPRAKRVIFLFMKGGPSQVDLFDPKPAIADRRGEDLPDFFTTRFLDGFDHLL